MTVEIYIAVCLTVIVIAIGVVTVFIALALWQLRRAARALEGLSLKVGGQLGRLEGVAQSLGHVALAATGKLGKGAALGASLAYGLFDFFRHRRRTRAAEEEFKEPVP